MKALFIGKGADNPSTRYRLEPVAQKLREMGHHVSVIYEPDFLTQAKILLIPGTLDVLFIQRKLLSRPMVRLLRMKVRKLVFDVDDAVFLRSNGQVSRSRRGKFNATVDASDLVFSGNRYLCESVQARNVPAELTPTCVSMRRYDAAGEKLPSFTLVWIGSSSTSKYLEYVREDLEEIGRTFPDIRLRVIADFDFKLENLEVEVMAWSDEIESEALLQCHAGIAPMKDNNWTRGKCALKVIQYMAAGLPVISSDVGANAEVLRDGETGFLVSERREWVGAIGRLMESQELRETMGRRARTVAEQNYSISDVSMRVANRLIDLAS